MALGLFTAALSGCSNSNGAESTTTIATTTSTTMPSATNLIVDGVRPGVLQAPFYPDVAVTQVSCGPAPSGGQFVRLDLPAGGPGTPAHSVLSHMTAVIVVPGAALLIDPRYPKHVLYDEAMQAISTTMGVFVLTLNNIAAVGGDGATVVAGNVQINGDYQCPSTQVPYPGT